MFKKLLLLALVVMLASPVWASQTQTEMIDARLTKSSPTEESDLFIGSSNKVSYFVTFNSSRDVTDAVSANVSAQVSIDGINWTNISWIDKDGNVTNTKTLKSDGTYVMSFSPEVTAPQVRIRVNMTNSANYGPLEYADITVTAVEKK